MTRRSQQVRTSTVRRGVAFAVAATVLAISALASAHAFRPTLFRLNLAPDGAHHVTWKWDGQDPNGVDATELTFTGCESELIDASEGADRLTHIRLACPPGPVEVVFDRPPREFVVDLRNDGALVSVERRLTDEVRFTFGADIVPGEEPAEVSIDAWSWLVVGVEHIVFGWDHLIFVVALAMLVRTPRRTASVVTGFTLGHSVTLVLTTLGVVAAPSSAPVEALIALSVGYLALEITRGDEAQRQFAGARGFGVTAAIGLAHGFGFAGALAELEIPRDAAAIPLAMFNLGVEAGQLAIVAPVVLVIFLVERRGGASGQRAIRTAQTVVAYVAGSIATYWFIDRVLGFG